MTLLVPVLGFCALNWDTQKIELTVKPGDKEAVGVFHFTNQGNTPVTIASVQPGCDCTTAELTKRSYAPGEAGEIKAVFTIGDRVGLQEKLLYLTTDAAPAAPTVLMLRVNIQEPLTCSSRLLVWCTAEPLAEKSVIITSTGSQEITTIETSQNGPVAAATRIETIAPGTKYRISIMPASLAKEANLSVDFIANFADNTTQRFLVYVVVRDLPDWHPR